MTRRVNVVDDEAQRQQTSAAKSFSKAAKHALKVKSRIAFDCEGVDLSRIGSLEIVSLCFEDPSLSDVTYLVDLGKKTGSSRFRTERVEVLKELFECKEVVKIIHDCRQDCDALFHLLGIEVYNVHDTSFYHIVVSGKAANASLNDTLVYYGVPTNPIRNTSVYSSNPAFWATRPMTPQMKKWASSDVDKLLVLANKQKAILVSRSRAQLQKAVNLSNSATTSLVRLKLERGLQCKIPMGAFIGKKGSNLKRVEQRTGTRITYRGSIKEWIVYYSEENSLAQVKRAMGY